MPKLTQRELDVLKLACLSINQTAERLEIKPQTVKNHWTSIMNKFGIPIVEQGTRRRMQAVKAAVQSGQVDLCDFEPARESARVRRVEGRDYMLIAAITALSKCSDT